MNARTKLPLFFILGRAFGVLLNPHRVNGAVAFPGNCECGELMPAGVQQRLR
jgi:hypothetical protein